MTVTTTRIPCVQRKIEGLWLKSRGLTHADIAELADVSPRSVQRYLDEFEQGGLDRVRRLNWQGKACALDEHQPSLDLKQAKFPSPQGIYLLVYDDVSSLSCRPDGQFLLDSILSWSRSTLLPAQRLWMPTRIGASRLRLQKNMPQHRNLERTPTHPRCRTGRPT
jgi:hypothetical protein